MLEPPESASRSLSRVPGVLLREEVRQSDLTTVRENPTLGDSLVQLRWLPTRKAYAADFCIASSDSAKYHFEGFPDSDLNAGKTEAWLLIFVAEDSGQILESSKAVEEE